MANTELTAFQSALLDSVLLDYENTPAEDAIEDAFSDKFYLWAQHLIRKQCPKRLHLRTTLWAALIALILTALLTCSVWAIPAVQKAVIGYSIVPREETNGISFHPHTAANAPDSIETAYIVTFVPEGYQLIEERLHPIIYQYWQNEKEQFIVYCQYPVNKTDNPNWIGIGDPDTPRKKCFLADTSRIYS